MKARVKVNGGNSRVITSNNLTRLCWTRGFRGVPHLASHIGRNRVTVWRAVRWPEQFGPTYRLIQEALL